MPIHASRQPLDLEHEAGVARLENHELWGITLPLIASYSTIGEAWVTCWCQGSEGEAS